MSIAQQTPNSKQKIYVQVLTLLTGLLLLCVKFFAYFKTHSNAILTDALESIINVIAGGFSLYGLYLAAKPHDEDHPYGHGKIEFIAASIEGSLILSAGIAMIVKSCYNFFYPVKIASLDIGLILVVLSALVNFFMGLYATRSGEKNGSLILVASGAHLRTDAYTSVGLLAGLGLILLTGLYWLDNVIAILMGAAIIYSGFRILKRSVAGIMDEADFALLAKVVDHLNRNRRPNWQDIHNLRIIKFGDKIHIDCHATIPWYFNAIEVHDELKIIEEKIKEVIPNNLETFIHSDPCLPKCCEICYKSDCVYRVYPLVHTIEWTLDNVMRNEKHFLIDISDKMQ
jgi:cation diffusion facilitator family transporter